MVKAIEEGYFLGKQDCLHRFLSKIKKSQRPQALRQ